MGPLLPCVNSLVLLPNPVVTLPPIAATLGSALLVHSRWQRNVLEGMWSSGMYLVDQRTLDAINSVVRLVNVGFMPVGGLVTRLPVTLAHLMSQIRRDLAGRYVEPPGETADTLAKLLVTLWLLALIQDVIFLLQSLAPVAVYWPPCPVMQVGRVAIL